MAAMALGVFEQRSGRVFLLGIGLWAIGRSIAALVWRDQDVVGTLNADQVLTLAFAAVALGTLVVGLIAGTASGRRTQAPSAGGTGMTTEPYEPTWPDSESRPRI